MSTTKPMIGLAVGGTLGLLDGLSGFLEPSLAPLMGSVITFSLLKGLVSGVAIGFLSKRVHSMPLGILAGVLIAAVFQHAAYSESRHGVVLGHHAPRHASRRDRGVRHATILESRRPVIPPDIRFPLVQGSCRSEDTLRGDKR